MVEPNHALLILLCLQKEVLSSHSSPEADLEDVPEANKRWGPKQARTKKNDVIDFRNKCSREASMCIMLILRYWFIISWNLLIYSLLRLLVSHGVTHFVSQTENQTILRGVCDQTGKCLQIGLTPSKQTLLKWLQRHRYPPMTLLLYLVEKLSTLPLKLFLSIQWCSIAFIFIKRRTKKIFPLYKCWHKKLHCSTSSVWILTPVRSLDRLYTLALYGLHKKAENTFQIQYSLFSGIQYQKNNLKLTSIPIIWYDSFEAAFEKEIDDKIFRTAVQCVKEP